MKCQQRCRAEFYIVHDTALEEIHLLTNQSPPFATLCRVASKADIRASFIQNSQEMSCETSFVLREKGSLFCESKKRNCNVKKKKCSSQIKIFVFYSKSKVLFLRTNSRYFRINFCVSLISCIPSVLHLSCPASLLSCLSPFLHPTFHASHFSCIPPFMHPTFPVK